MRLVESYYIGYSALFILVYAAGVFIGLPIVIPLSVLGGYLFGLWFGVLYSLLGAVAGSIAYFLLIQHTISQKKNATYTEQLAHFKKLMHAWGPHYLLFLHFTTIVPYLVINTLAALAQVPLATFIWTTTLGAIPGLFLYSFAGQQLGVIESAYDIIKPQFFLLFLVLAIASLMPIIINKWQAHNNSTFKDHTD